MRVGMRLSSVFPARAYVDLERATIYRRGSWLFRALPNLRIYRSVDCANVLVLLIYVCLSHQLLQRSESTSIYIDEQDEQDMGQIQNPVHPVYRCISFFSPAYESKISCHATANIWLAFAQLS